MIFKVNSLFNYFPKNMLKQKILFQWSKRRQVPQAAVNFLINRSTKILFFKTFKSFSIT